MQYDGHVALALKLAHAVNVVDEQNPAAPVVDGGVRELGAPGATCATQLQRAAIEPLAPEVIVMHAPGIVARLHGNVVKALSIHLMMAVVELALCP